MELTKNVVRQWIQNSESALAEGTSIPEWHEGRLSVYEFLLTFDLPEGY
jgi:hypothetical protein